MNPTTLPNKIIDTTQATKARDKPEFHSGENVSIARCATAGFLLLLMASSPATARSISIGTTTGTILTGDVISDGILVGPVGANDTLPDDGLPPIPGFWLKVLSAEAIEITWYDSSSREDGYNLYRQADGGVEVLIGTFTTVKGLPEVYVDSGLTADTTHNYRLEAFNNKGARSTTREVYTDRIVPLGTSHVAQVRLLSHNVQGLPTHTDPITRQTECKERTSAFGEWVAGAIPAYTVAGLQELYPKDPLPGEEFTCNPNHLLNAARASGRYQSSDNMLLHIPRSGIATGGTSIFALNPMTSSFGEAWVGNYDGLLGQGSRQGFLFARVPVPESDVELDVYVVHIYSRFTDHCNTVCQRGELEQLAQRIAQTSANSGNPVVVLGDFNIAGPPLASPDGDGAGASYNDILDALLDPRDLWLENHPGEIGATTLPTINDREGRRIDYIFLPVNSYFTNSPYQLFIRNRDDVNIAMWGWGFGPVSDHRGLDALIEIRINNTLVSQTVSTLDTTVKQSTLSAINQLGSNGL